MKFKYTAIAAACMVVAPLAQAQYSNTAQPNARPAADSPTQAVTRMAANDSETVRRVQEQLAQRGFDPGPADGQMGPQTRSALRNFQQSKGMSDTGLDSQTLEALGVQGGTTRHDTTSKGEGTMGTAPAQQGTPSTTASPSSAGKPSATAPRSGTSRHDAGAAGEGTMGTAPSQQGAPSRNAAPSSQGMPASPTGTGGTTPQDTRAAGEGTMGTAPTQQPNATRK